ncbi:organic solute transporter subunit beta [Xenopus laevis]|uniref:Organic Solute transporter subunit beta n=2 Tax=Xenopus laevis TaxID=8355 RepID=A0A1L8GSD6_XENLA|nr:organic solute transporter subunit beta [Xenopus laevis]XP_041444133.1 organic solute transporter subunit beta [Xenopus laevis]OCT86754.1 hypothetical protein XELAEV_18020443mg [Xenopus laevis]
MADSSQQDDITTTPSAAQKKLQRAIWFFRSGDLTTWNYAILGLALAGLVLGMFLLIRNILGNRKRKMIEMHKKNEGSALPEEVDNKQAEVHLEKEDPLTKNNLLQQEMKSGDITMQWKDGNIESLYTILPEEDV